MDQPLSNAGDGGGVSAATGPSPPLKPARSSYRITPQHPDHQGTLSEPQGPVPMSDLATQGSGGNSLPAPSHIVT